MKKIMLIGSVGVGKTTLMQKILKKNIVYDKTQVIEFVDNIVDTPGEYLENRQLLKALISTAANVDLVILLEEVNTCSLSFSHGFGYALNKPCIGIITKIDQKYDAQVLGNIKQYMLEAGVTKIFKLGNQIEDDFEELINYLY